MTAAALSNTLRSILTRAGAENPAGDSELILCAALGCSRSRLAVHRFDEVSDAQADAAAAMARRRASGEPIQYILGSWSFMGCDYRVGEGVLIPRDDTEVVVRAALGLMKDIPRPAIVDLCAGSGIIAITLYKELPDASVAAVEKSGDAFGYLRQNASLNGADIRLINDDLCRCADRFDDGSLDLIISNPPYIPTAELPALQSEVQYEPRLALDGGEDGCGFYPLILAHWAPKLKEGGIIAFELGEGQYDTVADLLRQNGFTDIRGYEDILGTLRAVTARYKLIF